MMTPASGRVTTPMDSIPIRQSIHSPSRCTIACRFRCGRCSTEPFGKERGGRQPGNGKMSCAGCARRRSMSPARNIRTIRSIFISPACPVAGASATSASGNRKKRAVQVLSRSDIGIGIQSPNSQPAVPIEPAAPQVESPKAAISARHWILWVIAIGLGIALLTILGNLDGDNSATTVRTPPPSPQVSQAPGESKSGGLIASINPAMPPAGGAERKPFTREEIYYCLTREYRKDVINDILSTTNTPTPASFFSDVADYNSRCKNYAFSNPDLEAAKSTFELNKARILDEASAEADSFKKIFLGLIVEYR